LTGIPTFGKILTGQYVQEEGLMKELILAGTASVLALTLAVLAIWNRSADRLGPNRWPRLDRHDQVELVARLWVA
jgi:hypothetical protein